MTRFPRRALCPAALAALVVLAALAALAAVLACAITPAVSPTEGVDPQEATLQAMQATLSSAQATLSASADITDKAAPASPGGQPALPVDAVISGSLSFPSEGIPALRVVAFDSQTLAPVAVVDIQAGEGAFTLTVPNGTYVVVAYTLDGALAGGYTQAVPCGLAVECTDHTLIEVPIADGVGAEGIDPGDWYAPEDSFPPMP